MFKVVAIFVAFIATITASPSAETLAAPINVITSQSSQYFARNLNAYATPVPVAAVPVAARIEAEPVAVAPVVTAQSSQFISRNHNALVTPVAAVAAAAPIVAAPAQVLARAAPVVAQATPARIGTNAVPVATARSSQYFIRNNNLVLAPLVAAPAVVNRPAVTNEELPVVEEARVRTLSNKLIQRQAVSRADSNRDASQQVTRSSKIELLDSNTKTEAQPQARSRPAQLQTYSNLILGSNLQFAVPAAPYLVGPRVYL